MRKGSIGAPSVGVRIGKKLVYSGKVTGGTKFDIGGIMVIRDIGKVEIKGSRIDRIHGV